MLDDPDEESDREVDILALESLSHRNELSSLRDSDDEQAGHLRRSDKRADDHSGRLRALEAAALRPPSRRAYIVGAVLFVAGLVVASYYLATPAPVVAPHDSDTLTPDGTHYRAPWNRRR